MSLILLYTGNGKGKTTASLGLVVRAVGHGKSVSIIQFLKGNPKYGEIKGLSYLPGVEIIQSGSPNHVKKNKITNDDIKLAKKGLELALEKISSGKYDLVILDEINVAIYYDVLKLQDVLNILEKKHEKTTIILTGRYAPKEFYEIADMVSEVKEIKHHFQKGIIAQEGIEY
ncbi:cob(I)yrinic acid a,c-diamide adenosyltransferase [Marinitoga sp. 38H-ov]|uniref:cob(I)yrinic acid a,c-diamide adenosyltransferase n=1 Tax=Marinitoga sp. 38H-ov TaxID=1755814 RepID=UPI0013EA3174|nr:cob(I)yrinic acid a,c-diamide adenosyltransferase [Marinitoga sp. 38H-ov]KAF2956981.1 cob(I)yrinic acid a,c-diamide adenosyltransferase [Marinitoga sp. 38H-ov]